MSNSETLLNSGTHDGSSSSSKALSDVQRFAKGVDLNAKIIGIEDVKQDSGDEICKTSMIKLKAVLKAAKPKVHKQKVVLRLTLDGIEIFDRLNHNSLYKHTINRISYISRDPTDSRAIGYIYKNSANEFKFYAIKTENEAQEMFLALKDLFEAVLEVQKKNRTASIAAVAAAAATQKGSAVDVAPTYEEPQQTDSQIMSDVIAETNQLISGLEDKIKQMNEQPNLLDMVEEPASPASSIPVGTPSDRFQASIEKSLDDALASQQTKSSSNDLFGVFTVDNGGLAANRPTAMDRYTALTGSLGSPAFPGQPIANAGFYQQPQLHQQQPPHFALSALSTSPNPFQPSPLMTGQPGGYYPQHTSPVSPANPFGAPSPFGHHQFQQQQQTMVRQQSFDPAFAAARPGVMIPQQPMRPPPVPNVPVSQSPFSDLMVPNMLSQASQAAAANKPAPANNNNNNSFPW